MNNQTTNEPKFAHGSNKGTKTRTTRKVKDEPDKRRNVVAVWPCDAKENLDAASARVLTTPSLQAAATIQEWQGDNQEVNALAKELEKQITVVNKGGLGRAEGMLIAQAHTLDELFNNLARRAHHNLGEYMNAAETYLRLALKAQSQCRATLETLAQIKNPPSVAFVKQANIAAGSQQVNNGVVPDRQRARENEDQLSKLSEDNYELLSDTGASALTGEIDTPVGTLETIDRPQDNRGKGASRE